MRWFLALGLSSVVLLVVAVRWLEEGPAPEGAVSPLAPPRQEPARESLELVELPAPPTPVLSADDAYLAAIVEVYGMPTEGLAGLSKRGMGKTIAFLNMAPLYPTRLAAISDRLSGMQRNKLLECVSGMLSRGALPADYLSAPLADKAVLWEPIGREYAEEIVMFGTLGGPQVARQHFRERFLTYFHVERFETPVLDFERQSRWNPVPKAISSVAKADLVEIELRYAKAINSLVSEGGLLDHYFDARALKWANQDFVALPFNATEVLGACVSAQTIRSLNGVAASMGWTVGAEILPGDYPPFDHALEGVRAVVQLRNDELTEYVRTML